MPFKFNPITGQLDLVNRRSTGLTSIPELTADPVAPSPEDAWVLHRPVAGAPIGLLLALTHAKSRYYHSYQTNTSGVKRTELT